MTRRQPKIGDCSGCGGGAKPLPQKDGVETDQPKRKIKPMSLGRALGFTLKEGAPGRRR